MSPRAPACSPRSRSIHAGLLLLCLSLSAASSESTTQHRSNQLQSQPPEAEPVPLNNDFDWKLVKEVFRYEQKNTIFSPFSVKLLLTLLYEASTDNSTTRRELARALAGSNLDKNRQLYREFLESSTKENSDYEFNIGTRIFLDATWGNITEEYQKLVQSCYKTELEKVTFKDARVSAERINDWCAKVSRGHINDLVQEDDLATAEMILANVLFLKASWRNSFPEESSGKRDFYVTDNNVFDADFMEQTDLYEYANSWELQLEMLKLPYKGRHFSMIILLPYANSSVEAMGEALTMRNLAQLEQRFEREETNVIIPKFKFDYGVTLNEVLQKLGISEIFTKQAALEQLSEGRLAVTKIFQKAGIEVNEKGTLAVAATEIQLVNKFGLGDSPTKFEANRPFIFYIKDEDSDAVLFVGKVLNPAS